MTLVHSIPLIWSLLGRGIAPAPIYHTPSIEEQVVRAAISEGIPAQLAVNTAWRESRFNPKAHSKTDDFGIMQLNRHWFPSAPRMTTAENIRAGVRLIASYWRSSHDEACSYRAYNRGPQALKSCPVRRVKRGDFILLAQ